MSHRRGVEKAESTFWARSSDFLRRRTFFHIEGNARFRDYLRYRSPIVRRKTQRARASFWTSLRPILGQLCEIFLERKIQFQVKLQSLVLMLTMHLVSISERNSKKEILARTLET